MARVRDNLMLLLAAAVLATPAAFAASVAGSPDSEQQLRFSIRADPKTFDPLLTSDEPSATVLYMTGGVLIRIDRRSHQLAPELATSWKISESGRRIDLQLRRGVQFADGSPFSCDDVVFTLNRLMKPELHSPVADPFRTAPGAFEARCTDAWTVTARFPGPIANLAELFDQVPMLSSKSPGKLTSVLGPFYVADYRPGTYVLLKKNPNYWKRDSTGRRLPYLDSIRLDIQQNRDAELLRFQRGQVHLINKLAPDLYDRVAAQSPKSAIDAGPSLDWEVFYFNQAAKAALPDYKKRWFGSANFRRAISMAVNRDDICKVAFRGHAQPAERHFADVVAV